MQGMLITPLTMFLLFQFFLRFFLVYKRDVVTALAFRTLQPYDICHTFHPISTRAPLGAKSRESDKSFGR
jgi:hypothetical protein